MSTILKAFCPVCQTTIDVPYVLVGATVPCPSCSNRVVPQVALGTSYPETGYQMTFSDFSQLLTNKDSASSVADLLFAWYGHTAVTTGEGTLVKSREGEIVDLVELHQQVQQDSAKQLAVYRAAMALWR